MRNSGGSVSVLRASDSGQSEAGDHRRAVLVQGVQLGVLLLQERGFLGTHGPSQAAVSQVRQ